MTVRKLFAIIILIIIFLFEIGFAQTSGRVFRKTGILNGNRVKTVFGNWGVIGQPSTGGPRGAWIFDTNGYVGDVSPMVGAEVINGTYTLNGVVRDTLFHWVIDVPVNRPSTGGFDNDELGNRQAFEPVGGYFNPFGSTPAISSNSNSWPASWPDKPSEFDGFWNGLFGKQPNADLETYFVMDDNNDNEFSLPRENPDSIVYKPDPDNLNRNGLGLEMRVRGLQWQQILAQDVIFWVYEISNQSKYTYPRTVFGMLVGTYVGVTGADDGPAEYDDDYSFFDVNEDLTFTGDFPNNNDRNAFWQGSVGLVGYAFLESPGNPFDGIDNDNDAATMIELPSGPLFTEDDFSVLTVTNSPNPGSDETNTVITTKDTIINNQRIFERKIETFPAGQDTFIVVSLGETITLISGETKLAEGNFINVGGEQQVNENSFDGKDNDLDGLIDENYFLHYRQRRVTSDGDILFDILNPVRHVDYISGAGSGDGLIDERRDDGIDNDGDWSRNPLTGEFLYDDMGVLLDDVGIDGIPNTGDFGENDGMPTPGEPNFDQTDKNESDQIGLSSFDYFVPAGEIPMADDADMWRRMRPGFFDVPKSFINGRPTQGEDGDFVYSSGYFPLTPDQTERMSLALIYAFDLDAMIKKLRTVRKIYDSDYRFPIAPDKPTLTAVAGNDSVILYWDRVAENSFDPVLREFDFEGYKIYRATDPGFLDAQTVTNSRGDVVAFKPIAQFDYANEIYGFFYPPNDVYQELDGWAFYLGDDTSLKHSYVDYDVKNGQTYYYAVVSYDRGVDSTGVIPSECTKKIDQSNTGEITLDINTAQVIPSYPAAGYIGPVEKDTLEHVAGDGTGTVKFKILDHNALTGNEYQVYFWDTSNDSIDNNNNGLIDQEDPEELESITTRYAVQDMYTYKEDVIPNDTSYVQLQRQNLVPESVIVMDGVGNVIPDSLYVIDYENGRIRPNNGDIFDNIAVTIQYQYHPVYFSPYMQGTPWLVQTVNDADIFDGLTLIFDNIWKTSVENLTSTWNDPSINYSFTFSFEETLLPDGTVLTPVFFPSNYELQIFDTVVDTTTSYFEYLGIPAEPRKFKIINSTGGYKIDFFHVDSDGDSLPSVNERIYFFEKDVDGEFTIFTWLLRLVLIDDSEEPYVFKGGEILFLRAKFPFNKFDLFAFQTELPKIDVALEKSDLDNIKVFPNPYIAAHEFEAALPPNVTSGRGERKIYFSNLPQRSKVHIFTSRGDLVRTLENDNSLTNGTIIWDLKTRENLDIAFGVYFYVVESDAGIKRGKLAVIK